MTPDQRRAFLISRGFQVAGRSFDGGATFSMVDLDDTRKLAPGKRPVYFIELSSGRWQLSGQGWKDWTAGPWHELAESECEQLSEVVSDSTLQNSRRNSPQGSAEARAGETPAVVSNVILTPDFAPDGRRVERLYKPSDLKFFQDCIAAGFEIVEPGPRLLDGYRDLGNREARYQGKNYTLICSAKTIMGAGCQKFKLSDFNAAESTQHTVQQTAPKFVPPVSRPVFSETKVKVEMAGNTKQKALIS